MHPLPAAGSSYRIECRPYVLAETCRDSVYRAKWLRRVRPRRSGPGRASETVRGVFWRRATLGNKPPDELENRNGHGVEQSVAMAHGNGDKSSILQGH